MFLYSLLFISEILSDVTTPCIKMPSKQCQKEQGMEPEKKDKKEDDKDKGDEKEKKPKK